MVEGARLESVYRGNSIEGSNPSLSAIISCLESIYCGNPQFTRPSHVLTFQYDAE